MGRVYTVLSIFLFTARAPGGWVKLANLARGRAVSRTKAQSSHFKRLGGSTKRSTPRAPGPRTPKSPGPARRPGRRRASTRQWSRQLRCVAFASPLVRRAVSVRLVHGLEGAGSAACGSGRRSAARGGWGRRRDLHGSRGSVTDAGYDRARVGCPSPPSGVRVELISPPPRSSKYYRMLAKTSPGNAVLLAVAANRLAIAATAAASIHSEDRAESPLPINAAD